MDGFWSDKRVPRSSGAGFIGYDLVKQLVRRIS